MFKKPTKVKLKESSVKLTEVADSTASSDSEGDSKTANVSAALVPSKSTPASEGNSDIEKRPRQAADGHSKLIIEKPSKLLVSLLLAFTLGTGAVAAVVNGPLAPFTASMLHSYNMPYLCLFVLDGALLHDDKNTELLIQRATENEQVNAYELALKDINKAISLLPINSPALPGAYALQGQIFLDLNRRTEGENALKRAGELNKNVAEDYHQRAFKAIEYSNAPQLAIKLETVALLIDPNLPKSYLNRSFAYWQSNQYQKAIDDCSTALALPLDWKSELLAADLRQCLLNNRSDAYYGLGDYANSIKDAMAAAALADKAAPNPAIKPSQRPWRSLVKAYLANNQPDLALKATGVVKDKIVRDGPLLLMQKQALLMLKRNQEAENAGPASEAELGNAYNEFYNDARVYWKSKDYRNTVNACNLALLARPNEVWVLRMRAEGYLGLKMYDRVIEDTTSALSKEGGTRLKGWLLYMRAEAQQNLGHEQEARDDFERANREGYDKKWVKWIRPDFP